MDSIQQLSIAVTKIRKRVYFSRETNRQLNFHNK